MQMNLSRFHLFTPKPLSVFTKIVVVNLLTLSAFWCVLSLIVPDNVPLLVMAVVIFGIAGLLATGIRWTPIIGSLISAMFLLVLIFGSSFPLYHLAHPKDADGADSPTKLAISFILFIFITLLFWGLTINIGAGIMAVIQNYTHRVGSKPRWFNTVFAGLVGVLIGMILLGSLAQPVTATSQPTTTNGEATVHLMISSFSTPTVHVAKGAKLLMIDDGNYEHNLSNGTWVNGQPQPENVTGAPAVKSVNINGTGKQVEIGPFTTAGTYHLFCSLHTGMTLTIDVS